MTTKHASTPAPTNTPGTATKRIATSHGDFEIPLEAQRVVAMENRRDLETAVALKLPLVAVGIWGGAADPADVAAPFVPVDLTGKEILNTEEPDIERLLSLEPDLIVSREFVPARQLPRRTSHRGCAHRARVEQRLLAQPTWSAPRPGSIERRSSPTPSPSTTRSSPACQETHAAALESASIAIVEWYAPDSTFYAGAIDGFQLQANTLGQLGGSLIDFQAGRDYFGEPFSFENVGELAAADAILLVGPQSGDTLDGLQQQELWQQLPAAQSGRVTATDTRMNQGSIFAAMECLRLLDELYGTLA
ncbi:MAG: hypothetical protein U5Q44_01800 [Dehalococcoidia bacterium]|nr:hypothetical protein [Dehalococcoidia bacterium]